MKSVDWLWPNNKRIAVVFNVCLEQWSDGKAPGISPMGNPLPAGVLDTMAISWAAYGVKTGIYRLLEAFKRHGAKTSVMVNAVCAERAPSLAKLTRQCQPQTIGTSSRQIALIARHAIRRTHCPARRFAARPVVVAHLRCAGKTAGRARKS